MKLKQLYELLDYMMKNETPAKVAQVKELIAKLEGRG